MHSHTCVHVIQIMLRNRQALGVYRAYYPKKPNGDINFLARGERAYQDLYFLKHRNSWPDNKSIISLFPH